MQAHQPPAKKGSVIVTVSIAGLVMVTIVTGLVLYFYRGILKDANPPRSKIGGCINEIFRASSDVMAGTGWSPGEFQLPVMDAQVSVKYELPDDLSQYGHIAAFCCAEGEREASAACAEALRGFVEEHPGAADVVGDDARPMKELAAQTRADASEIPAPESPPGSSAEAAVAAVLAEPSAATQLTRAFALMADEDDGVRATALRAFYAAESLAVRRAAVIHALEQTQSGERKLLIEGSLPESAKAASEATVQGQQKLVDSLMGRSLTRVEIDRATGAFSCRITGACDGTVSDREVMIFAGGWKMKLKPEPDSPALSGTYTYRGSTINVRIRLM